jgi:hypothetical protein
LLKFSIGRIENVAMPKRSKKSKTQDKWDEPKLHWGRWLRERSRHVGFLSQKGLIDAIGCEQTTFYNWVKSPLPPDRMQKGFDLALARALRVDRQMLFTGWRKKKADQVPLTDASVNDSTFVDDERMRDAIKRNVRYLEGESLRAILKISREEINKLSDIVVNRVRVEDFGRDPDQRK